MCSESGFKQICINRFTSVVYEMLFNCGISEVDLFGIIKKIIGEYPSARALFVIIKIYKEINLMVICFEFVYTGVTDFPNVFRQVFTY